MFGEGGSGLGAGNLPWYAYAAAIAVVVFVGQTIAKIASDAIKDIESANSEQPGGDCDLPL